MMNGVQERTANVCKPDTPSDCQSFPAAVVENMVVGTGRGLSLRRLLCVFVLLSSV